MKKFLLFLFLSLQIFTTQAQLSMEWQREHCPSRDTSKEIWVDGFTTDKAGNSFIIANFYSDEQDKVIKYNSDGFEEWEKNYPYYGSVFSTDNQWDCIQVDNKKNIYFVDKSKVANEFYLVKLDSTGNFLYQKPLVKYSEYDYYYLFIDKNDFANLLINDFTLVKHDTGASETDVLTYFRFDEDGNIRNRFNIPGLSAFQQLITGKDDNIYVSRTMEGPDNTLVEKYDTLGNRLWSVDNGPLTFDGKLFFSPDGNLIVVNEGGGIIKINPLNGSILKQVNNPNFFTFDNVPQDNDGNLYILSYDSANSYVLKYDYNLNLKYNFQPANTLIDYGYYIVHGKVNTYLVNYRGDGSVLPFSLFIEEIDSLGNLVTSKFIEDKSIIVYEAKPALDSLDNIYTCFRIEGYQADTLGYADMGLIKFCSSCTPNVSGNVFFDSNINCIHDSGEENLSNRIIELLPEQVYSVSDSSGKYSFNTGKGSHTIREILPNGYWKFSCDSVYNAKLDSTSQSLTNLNFGNTITEGINDLSVNMGYTPMRSGFNRWLTINYANNGTTDLTPVITMKFDTLFSYVSSNDSPVFISKDSLAWNVGLLKSNNVSTIHLLVHVSANAPSDYPFNIISRIYPIADDINPSDNIDIFSDIITNSFDPNEKIVYPLSVRNSGTVTSTSPVSYQINFQNTGTDTAFTVVVQDKIDPNLNLSTFKMEAASNPYQLSIINGRTLQWTFNNILLADSNQNEVASHGFLKYSISANPNISTTDIFIKNSAAIYFDYNVPVITDTVTLTEHGLNLINPVNSLFIYPNPTGSESIIAYKLPQQSNVELQMFDLFGRMINDWNLGSETPGVHYQQISGLQRFPSGLYFIRMITTNGNYVCKLSIER